MPDDKTFKITGATASSKGKFAVGLNLFPLDAEDPYTIFLTYDETLDQPWSRSDANRNLSDVANIGESYFCLSDEEYVYTLTGDNINEHVIKGMGIHAANATEGAGVSISNIDGTLIIVGQGQQVYRRDGKDSWVKISTEELKLGEGQKGIDFESSGGDNQNSIYVCGRTSPQFERTSKDLRAERSAAIAFGDKKRQKEIRKLIRKQRSKPEGRAYHWDGTNWTQIDVEDYFPKTIFVDSKGRAWMGCNKGTILQVERDEDGGFDVDDIEIIEDSRTDIYSITEFRGRLIMASAEGLFAYDEDFDSLDDEIVRIKPRLNTALGAKPSPLKVQAVDDVMFYFDYNLGIYIWDGDKKWTNIPIPPELLERDFKGLK